MCLRPLVVQYICRGSDMTAVPNVQERRTGLPSAWASSRRCYFVLQLKSMVGLPPPAEALETYRMQALLLGPAKPAMSSSRILGLSDLDTHLRHERKGTQGIVSAKPPIR